MKPKLSIVIVVLICFSLINVLGNNLFIYDKTFAKTIKKREPNIVLNKELDSFYSDKKLGSFVEDGKTFFRLFTPNAERVSLVTFKQAEDNEGSSYEMIKDKDGVWEASVEGELYGLFYGYKVKHSGGKDTFCIDPYARAVATYNTYWSPRKAIVVKEDDYNWEDDQWIKRDWRDLIIYEMHLRDMTAHPSSGADHPGTYKGLVEKGKPGGIDYIKNLGVNTIELLPAQEFANIEIPFKKSSHGRYNNWNPYERNHWGYMTAAFFAPAAYYSEDWSELKWNEWQGKTGKQVNDFKDMVKAFHKEGIAVMMDVVYNHLSEYELGNLKQIDKEYYFRLDKDGNYLANSGTGNDLKTERPMLRRLIVESILYWMKEYHIDGFRFDLGKLIDWETVETVLREAQKINPHVIIVCEPWGGGYDPMGFSQRGWGSWNDQIRNGIKGENPNSGHGWIFGKWFGNNNPDRIKSYINGTLLKDKHGLFLKKEHSVNYLESHDGYTIGDFIRIGLNDIKHDEVITDADANTKLTSQQMKLNKLGALFLLTSQGITMIHSGQEYARSKVITADKSVPDLHQGKIDHNSYEKDNETNYINYNQAKANKELVEYYKGLIELRNKYKAFRRADYNDILFFSVTNEFALGYHIKNNGDEILVLLNANPLKKEEFILPGGNWDILVNEKDAGIEPLGSLSGKVILETSTGMVLRKK
ncbi:MAG: alpha-amylase family glycosyl hydrolase [Ignavibacteriaceae bacterium]